MLSVSTTLFCAWLALAYAMDPVQLEAYLKDDLRRLDLLKGYEPGKATAEQVCADWKFSENGQIGFVGFSKQRNQFVIHMGRGIETLIQEFDS